MGIFITVVITITTQNGLVYDLGVLSEGERTEMSANWNRRGLLRTAGSGIGMAMVGAVGTAAGQEDSKASITFNDQTSDGTSVTIDRLETNVSGAFRVLDGSSSIAGPIGFESGTTLENYEVELSTPITESKTLSANFYEGGTEGIARDVAEITVDDPPELDSGMEPTLVEANPDAGFNYPYYLYAPSRPADSDPGSILVQPNNSGRTTDEFETHRQSARNRIDGGLSRRLSDRLSVPLLVPVFPRPQSEPVDWRHYVHALDRQTMQISDGPLERVDLQLLRMVDHARDLLSERSYAVDDQILLNGFSAAGNFVDRFAVLHPKRVRSVTAGGLNGMAMLPLEEAEGHTLDFHIGIADVEELTGEPVDLDALDEVDQFLFMGGEDGNDTIPYDDAWSEEMREVALDVYGEKMITERFPYCQSAYERAGVDAQFKVYEGVGHNPVPAMDDIVEFHRRSLDGEDVSDFDQPLGFEPAIEHTAEEAAVGEWIEFDAGTTEVGLGEALAYVWEFSDGETRAGQTVTRRFDTAGEYSVELTVIDDNGREATAEATVTVGGGSERGTSGSGSEDEPPSTEATAAGEGSSERTTSGNESDGASPSAAAKSDRLASLGRRITLPGVGVGVVVTSAVGGIYALGDRLRR